MTEANALLMGEHQRPDPDEALIVNGRYSLVPATGPPRQLYTRSTTWAKTLDDPFGLHIWKLRQGGKGLAFKPDLLARVAATKDNREIDELMEEAITAAGGDEGRNLGNALHSFCQRIDLGEEVFIPPPWDKDVDAYVNALVKAGVTIVPEYIERICVNEHLGVAGRFDRLVRLADGRLVVADLKTGKADYQWSSWAVQTAVYARSETVYDEATETHSPMPEVDQATALIIHLPVRQATCTLYAIDIDFGWQGALLAGMVRNHRRNNSVAAPLATWPSTVVAPVPIRPPEAEPPVDAETTAAVEAWVRRRLADMIERGFGVDVAKRWPRDVPTFKSDHRHTLAELDAIADAISWVEGDKLLPFSDDTDPRRS
jgi:hypothetical protein